MKDNNHIDEYIVDAITGRPHGFFCGKKHLALFPVTLGKMLLVQEVLTQMGVQRDMLAVNPSLEVLRLVKTRREQSMMVIAYHTFDKKEDVLNGDMVQRRVRFLSDSLTEEDAAALLIMCLSSDKTDTLMSHFGIDKENKRMAEVMKVKDTKNSLSFGGKSQYGMLIDTACERYGWTKDYVVWGIDYASLRLMLADKISSLYLSDEELKKVPALQLKEGIDASDPENAQRIIAALRNRGIAQQ